VRATIIVIAIAVVGACSLITSVVGALQKIITVLGAP